MAHFEYKATKKQLDALPKIVKKLNHDGAFLTVSSLDGVIRASSPFEKDIRLFKKEIYEIK